MSSGVPQQTLFFISTWITESLLACQHCSQPWSSGACRLCFWCNNAYQSECPTQRCSLRCLTTRVPATGAHRPHLSTDVLRPTRTSSAEVGYYTQTALDGHYTDLIQFYKAWNGCGSLHGLQQDDMPIAQAHRQGWPLAAALALLLPRSSAAAHSHGRWHGVQTRRACTTAETPPRDTFSSLSCPVRYDTSTCRHKVSGGGQQYTLSPSPSAPTPRHNSPQWASSSTSRHHTLSRGPHTLSQVVQRPPCESRAPRRSHRSPCQPPLHASIRPSLTGAWASQTGCARPQLTR